MREEVFKYDRRTRPVMVFPIPISEFHVATMIANMRHDLDDLKANTSGLEKYFQGLREQGRVVTSGEEVFESV